MILKRLKSGMSRTKTFAVVGRQGVCYLPYAFLTYDLQVSHYKGDTEDYYEIVLTPPVPWEEPTRKRKSNNIYLPEAIKMYGMGDHLIQKEPFAHMDDGSVIARIKYPASLRRGDK